MYDDDIGVQSPILAVAHESDADSEDVVFDPVPELFLGKKVRKKLKKKRKRRNKLERRFDDSASDAQSVGYDDYGCGGFDDEFDPSIWDT